MSLYLGSNLISGVFTTFHTTTYDTSDATAQAQDILSGKTAYVNGTKITGTMPQKSGSDITKSGASFTVPSGYYSSSYTGTIASGALRTPTYTANASTRKVTITYGVSTAGYLATSSPTFEFTPFAAGTIRTPTASANTSTGAVTITYGVSTAGLVSTSTSTTTVTPFTVQNASGYRYITPSSSATSYLYSAGYYPNSHGYYVYAATGGGVTVGTFTIDAASTVNSVNLSTNGYPDGFCFSSVDRIYDFVGNDNEREIFAGQINSGFTSGSAIPCLAMRWRSRPSRGDELYYIGEYLNTRYCQGTYSSYTLTISTPNHYFAKGSYKYAIWY